MEEQKSLIGESPLKEKRIRGYRKHQMQLITRDLSFYMIKRIKVRKLRLEEEEEKCTDEKLRVFQRIMKSTSKMRRLEVCCLW